MLQLRQLYGLLVAQRVYIAPRFTWGCLREECLIRKPPALCWRVTFLFVVIPVKTGIQIGLPRQTYVSKFIGLWLLKQSLFSADISIAEFKESKYMEQQSNIKSRTTILLDTIRGVLTYFGTGISVYYVGKYNLVLAVFVAIPIFIIMIYILGFLTLPLYFFTPESRAANKMLRSLENCDMESFNEQVKTFEKDFMA
jgi:hypothetical protein